MALLLSNADRQLASTISPLRDQFPSAILLPGNSRIDGIPDKIIQRNLLDGSNDSSLFMKLRGYSNVETAFIDFIGRLIQTLTGVKIIFHSILKGFFQPPHGIGFKIHQIIYTDQFAKKDFVCGTEMYLRVIVFVL